MPSELLTRACAKLIETLIERDRDILCACVQLLFSSAALSSLFLYVLRHRMDFRFRFQTQLYGLNYFWANELLLNVCKGVATCTT